VDLNDQPRSGRPVTTVHNVNGQTAETLKICFAPFNEIIAGLLTKNYVPSG